MSYKVVKLACEGLPVPEKLKLAQYLIQSALHTTENQHTENQHTGQPPPATALSANTMLSAIEERVLKSRPSKTHTMQNFIRAMFQYRGGITDEDIDSIVLRMSKQNIFKIVDNRIIYPQLLKRNH